MTVVGWLIAAGALFVFSSLVKRHASPEWSDALRRPHIGLLLFFLVGGFATYVLRDAISPIHASLRLGSLPVAYRAAIVGGLLVVAYLVNWFRRTYGRTYAVGQGIVAVAAIWAVMADAPEVSPVKLLLILGTAVGVGAAGVKSWEEAAKKHRESLAAPSVRSANTDAT